MLTVTLRTLVLVAKMMKYVRHRRWLSVFWIKYSHRKISSRKSPSMLHQWISRLWDAFLILYKPSVLHQSHLRNNCVNLMVKMKVLIRVSWLHSLVNCHAKRQSQEKHYPSMTETPLTQPTWKSSLMTKRTRYVRPCQYLSALRQCKRSYRVDMKKLTYWMSWLMTR